MKASDLPFATVWNGYGLVHVLVGFDEEGLVGFDPVSLRLIRFVPEDMMSMVSTTPATVFFGTNLSWVGQNRLLPNPMRRGYVPRFEPRGGKFPPLPEGVLSGYPVAAPIIQSFRHAVPSLDSVLISALFAVSTVRTSIEDAEKSFSCFAELYKRHQRMPSVEEIRSCFNALYNVKSELFLRVGEYAPVILGAIRDGLKDRELRRVLALESDLPSGLGLAKLSFTLALLGHNTVCIDGRLLNAMFPDPVRRDNVERSYRKSPHGFTATAVQRYEALEDAFLRGNRYYDPQDPLGAARAQWLSWEAVGGAAATHSVWLNAVRK